MCKVIYHFIPLSQLICVQSKMKSPLSLSNQICHRFYIASNAITRAYKPHLDALNLTYPQYIVMMALWEHKDVEVGQLQALTSIDSGALSLILKKLVQKDLIKVAVNPEDKRRKRVQLSTAGQELEQSAASIPAAMRCEFSLNSDQELAQLLALLDVINANFEG